MKYNKSMLIILAFLLGFGACLLVVNLRQSKNAAYLFAEVDVKDYETFAEYAKRVPKIVNKYGGKYIIRGGKAMHMEGDWIPKRLVLIEFNNAEDLKKCFNSPEYLAIKPFRDSSSISKSAIVSSFPSKKDDEI